MVEAGKSRHVGFALGWPYLRKHGPWVIGKGIDVSTYGLNCQTLVHLYYNNRFGVKLPIGMWTKEIYEDEGLLFETLQSEEYVEGDIFFFGKSEAKPISLHLAVYTGIHDPTGDMILRHANSVDNKVSDWPLGKFFQHKRYQNLHRVKRLVPDLFAIHIG
ncbi:MAG: C40 family peptidase [Candidatus Levybacteria bacterium]|nr:C40 family peptidase [Candidatus Levybacteria bacterium]